MARKKELVKGVQVQGIAHKGKSVGRTNEGLVIFMDGGVPGDEVAVRLLRKRKGVWHGVVEEITQPSTERREPQCQHFGNCGGCKWQHLSYEGQLAEKVKEVANSFTRLAKIETYDLRPILGSENIYAYRNKLEYSFSSKQWYTREQINSGVELSKGGALGLHPPGNFQKVVDLEKCWLQEDLSNSIRNFVRSYTRERYPYFDPLAQTGFMRNMILRNTRVGAWMMILSFAYEDEALRVELLEAVKNRFPEIASLHYVINRKRNDTLFDQEIICYHGKPFITEVLGNLNFRIRPKSFFQTNTSQAEILYDQVRDLAQIQPNDLVFDLYCGLGSITLYLADQCETIVGIEEVGDAIEDARINAELNKISHAHFYAGDVRQELTDDLVKTHGQPDVIITDPPRAGMHPEVVEKLIQLHPRRIVYVSCNPATQARDVQLLKAHYELETLQPVDMFPHTSHIENIASLRRI